MGKQQNIKSENDMISKIHRFKKIHYNLKKTSIKCYSTFEEDMFGKLILCDKVFHLHMCLNEDDNNPS